MQCFLSVPAGSCTISASLIGMNRIGLESPGLLKLIKPIFASTKKYSFHDSVKRLFSQLWLKMSMKPTLAVLYAA